jgi:transposase-like protein
MEDRQRRNRHQFTAEFKRDAVELVRTTGRPIAEIARELGIYGSTLGDWYAMTASTRGEQEGAFQRRAGTVASARARERQAADGV